MAHRDGCLPLGRGALLRVSGQPIEFVRWVWSTQDVGHLNICTGDPKHQTFWEFLTVALTLTVWGCKFRRQKVTILCDNSAALQAALDLKGRGDMLTIAREVAWRQAREKWLFQVAHLPNEQNTSADALSRMSMPRPASLPDELTGARELAAPLVSEFWKL